MWRMTKNIYLEEKLIMCQEDLLSKERQIAHLESELRYWIAEAICFVWSSLWEITLF